MTPSLLVVTYQLRIPFAAFRGPAETAARQIADAPGLIWKIWGLDPDTGEGTSAYLFRDDSHARAFAEGPAIAALREGPAAHVTTRLAPIDRELSLLTGAGRVLDPPAPD